MKAAFYYKGGRIKIQEVPKPEIGRNEALVEMKACGLCGSDLMRWYLDMKAPLVLGHEPSGIIRQVGEDVAGFSESDRVFIHHHVGCFTCHYCIHGDFTLCDEFRETHIDPGGFAQFIRVPYRNLRYDTLKLPEDVSFDEATIIELLACCIRGLGKVDFKPGDSILIVGVGPAGMTHAVLSRMLGFGKIIVSDPVEYRREFALKMEADYAFDPFKEHLAEEVRKVTSGRGVDVVVVTAPSLDALYDGLNACRRGGTICLFAPISPEVKVLLSPHKLFFNEVSVVPSYSTSHIETRIALNLIDSGRFPAEKLITHCFSLDDVIEAYRLASEDKSCMKIVIQNE